MIYGPVSSWRLGRSLGIDLINTGTKLCTFNCVYCQLGETRKFIAEPEDLSSLKNLNSEIQQFTKVRADYATFSGMGEPTLASNLGEAIELVRSSLKLPIAVLTNSSLLLREDVRDRLAKADLVVAKLDAPNEEIFGLVNRPASGLRFATVLDGLRRFSQIYAGKLALQVMFVRANEHYAPAIAEIARSIQPGEVQINTPLRPSKVKPLSPQHLARIRGQFSGLRRVNTVYEAPPLHVRPVDLADTLRRRPTVSDNRDSSW